MVSFSFIDTHILHRYHYTLLLSPFPSLSLYVHLHLSFFYAHLPFSLYVHLPLSLYVPLPLLSPLSLSLSLQQAYLLNVTLFCAQIITNFLTRILWHTSRKIYTTFKHPILPLPFPVPPGAPPPPDDFPPAVFAVIDQVMTEMAQLKLSAFLLSTLSFLLSLLSFNLRSSPFLSHDLLSVCIGNYPLDCRFARAGFHADLVPATRGQQ